MQLQADVNVWCLGFQCCGCSACPKQMQGQLKNVVSKWAFAAPKGKSYGKSDGFRFCCVLSVLTESDLKSAWMQKEQANT